MTASKCRGELTVREEWNIDVLEEEVVQAANSIVQFNNMFEHCGNSVKVFVVGVENNLLIICIHQTPFLPLSCHFHVLFDVTVVSKMNSCYHYHTHSISY